MNNVGFLAAMTIFVLGPASDVACFFNSVTCLLEGGERGRRFPYVTERLYRRSLRHDELVFVSRDMLEIEYEFRRLNASEVDFYSLGLDGSSTRLSFEEGDLSEVFFRFFSGFSEVVKCTDLFFSEFGEYVPVRIGFTDGAAALVDISRPVDFYEKLQGNPLWLI